MEKKNFDVTDLFKLKQIVNTKILPGKKYLFEEQRMDSKEDNYKSAIFMLHASSEKPKQFTSGLNQDKSMKPSYDKDILAFVSTRGGEKAKPQIFIMDIMGGEAVQYTKTQNGVLEFNWSLDSQKITYIHRLNLEEQEEENKTDDNKKLSDLEIKIKNLKKEESEKNKVDPKHIKNIVYRKETSFLDDRFSHIYVLDLKTKESERYTSGEFNYNFPVLGKDEKKIYAVKHSVKDFLNDSYEFLIVEIDLETKEETTLKTMYGFGTSLSISPDGRWLAYSGKNTPDILSTQHEEILILNTETKLEKWVSETINNHAFLPIFDNETNFLYFITDKWDRNAVQRYNIERETIEEVFIDDSLISSYDVDNEQGLILLNVTSTDSFSKLLVYDFVYKELTTLFKSNETILNERIIAETEEIKYRGHTDYEIQGWIVKPPNFDSSKKYPTIVNIHGGPHATWGPYNRSMWFEFQYFASKGYVIFYCNPRGSSGRGYDFRYVAKNWGIEPAQDILLGLENVIEKGYVDTENLFIAGGSYGGYMTAWITGHDERFKAAAPQRGVYNLVSFWSVTDITQFIKDEMGAFPWEDLNQLWEQSPIAYVNKTKTPTRIIHSENDFRVPIEQAEEYYASLLKLGVRAELIRYPEEGHELSRSGKPKHMKDRLEKIIEWFEIYRKA
ncbi:MAG: prolyl oligopeptidase family serine peptidase [Candidatus Heimdallarchaeaceae archaeon]